MCGRYTLTKTEGIPDFFEISEVRLPPRFNIAPTQKSPVVRLDGHGNRKLEALHWGLVPHWTKDLSLGPRLINARAETVHQKPAYRDAFRQQRCLVPADGFYEWQKMPDGKVPHFFSLKDRALFGFAGLWDRVEMEQGSLTTFSIITCEANELVSKIHSRMPVILGRDKFSEWLDPSTGSSISKSFLQPFPADQMQSYPVSRIVNTPKNDSPECVIPKQPTIPPLFQ